MVGAPGRGGGGWGTDTGTNCGVTKEKAKATLALLGSPQCLSRCWNARVLFNRDGNTFGVSEKKDG